MKKLLISAAVAVLALAMVSCKCNNKEAAKACCDSAATEAVAPACPNAQAACDMEKPCCKAEGEVQCGNAEGKCCGKCAEGKCCGKCAKAEGQECQKACVKGEGACQAQKECRKECPKAEGNACPKECSAK